MFSISKLFHGTTAVVLSQDTTMLSHDTPSTMLFSLRTVYPSTKLLRATYFNPSNPCDISWFEMSLSGSLSILYLIFYSSRRAKSVPVQISNITDFFGLYEAKYYYSEFLVCIPIILIKMLTICHY